MKRKGIVGRAVSPKEANRHNIASIILMENAIKSREELIEKIKHINHTFYQINTSVGDEADRSCNEEWIRNNITRLMFLQQQLCRVNSFIDAVSSPNFDGCCQSCGEDIPLARVLSLFSNICVECAR